MIRVVHPGSQIPDPDADFLPIPDPGSRGQKRTQSRIRNTVCISTSGYHTPCPSPTSCLVFFWFSRGTIPYLGIEVCDTVGAVLVLAQSFPDRLEPAGCLLLPGLDFFTDWIRIREGKMTHKKRKQLKKLNVLKY